MRSVAKRSRTMTPNSSGARSRARMMLVVRRIKLPTLNETSVRAAPFGKGGVRNFHKD